MKTIYPGIALALLLGAAASAATVNTTMTVRGSGALTGTTFSGTADLTGIGTGLAITGGTFGTNNTTGNYEAKFVINVSTADKLNVTISIPATILVSGSADAVGTITGGTGAYAGATGTFAKMPGTGSLNTSTLSLTLTFSGAGTITTGGTTGGGGTPGPTITDVLDAGSYTKNIARGSIFVVKGTLLSAAGFTQMSFPLPQTSSGVNITLLPRPAAQPPTHTSSTCTTREESTSSPVYSPRLSQPVTTTSPSRTARSARPSPCRSWTAKSA